MERINPVLEEAEDQALVLDECLNLCNCRSVLGTAEICPRWETALYNI